MLRLLILACLLAHSRPATRSAQVSPDDARQRRSRCCRTRRSATSSISTPEDDRHASRRSQRRLRARPAPPSAERPAADPPSRRTASAPRCWWAPPASSITLSGEAIAALGAIRSVPLLWAGCTVMATDPWARGILLDTALAPGRGPGAGPRGRVGDAAARCARPILALVRRAPNGGRRRPTKTPRPAPSAARSSRRTAAGSRR